MIENQVKLPLKVAIGVVKQGIRIRFGRSVVTIMGVVFGIAFLMSILAGQTLRKGVSEEDRIRSEVNRMYSFLASEMGPARGRSIGVVLIGPLSEYEQRLLRLLEEKDLKALKWTSFGESEFPVDSLGIPVSQVAISNPQELGEDVSAVLLLGVGEMPSFDWTTLFSKARQRVLACSRMAEDFTFNESVISIVLEREMRPDELAKLNAEKRKTKFRNNWITIISILVTIIGISNAMLMSVTERFREIGTMKCLGALSSFVRTLFLIESGFVGVIGGAIGCLFGFGFSLIVYGFTYGFGLVFLSLKTEFLLMGLHVFLALLAGILLSVLAAIYPAQVASKMVPANALRSNV